VTTFQVLTVDPGKQTGYGWAFIEDKTLLDVQFSELPFQEFNEKIDAYLRGTDPAVQRVDVFCERFVIGSGTARKSRGDVYWSIETIGILRHLCTMLGHRYEGQNQSDAKTGWADRRLKEIGWWIEGDKAAGIDGSHARDAAKHMVLALQRYHTQVYFDLVK
jgi:hypothetical protein